MAAFSHLVSMFNCISSYPVSIIKFHGACGKEFFSYLINVTHNIELCLTIHTCTKFHIPADSCIPVIFYILETNETKDVSCLNPIKINKFSIINKAVLTQGHIAERGKFNSLGC
jgi:hypothetical protein